MIDALLLILLPLGPIALCVGIARTSISRRTRALIAVFAVFHPLIVGWLGWQVGTAMPQYREEILQPSGALAIMMTFVSVLASLVAVPIGLGISAWSRRRTTTISPPADGSNPRNQD
jgi:formate hydrogenlyase subunit 3/multisubunit Na+/H+ antiporter MnhD subunit